MGHGAAMSARRQTGDRVWKLPGMGLVGEGAYVTLRGDPEECMMGCEDPDCQEWPDAWTDDGHVICHVSECMVETERLGVES